MSISKYPVVPNCKYNARKVVGAKSEASAEDNILSKMKSLTLSNQDARNYIDPKTMDMAQKKVSLLANERTSNTIESEV